MVRHPLWARAGWALALAFAAMAATATAGYQVTFTSCTLSTATPYVGQNVAISGTAGIVHGVALNEAQRIVLGFRDAAGNWVGGEPILIWSGLTGSNDVAWAGAVANITAPVAPGQYGVWVRQVPTANDAAAIAEFKATVVPGQDNRDKKGAMITVPTPPPPYQVTFTRQTHSPEPAVLGQDVTVSNTGGMINGPLVPETLRIVLGFRDAAGNWVGGEPQVVWTGAPGVAPVAWNGAAVVIAAPATAGIYRVWVRSASVADDAAAIAEFKAQTPTVDGVQDKRAGPDLRVVDGYLITFTSCTLSTSAPTVGQNVTISGTAGRVQSALPGETIKIVIGFRDAAGNWVGGDPQVVWTGVPGTSPVAWAGAAAIIAAPNTGGAYGVWVREVPTNDDATAIADFKAAVVAAEDNRDKRGATVDVPAPPPAYLVTFTRQTHAPEPAVLNENVLVSNTGGEINGGTPADTMRIVLGFRDAAGNWVGGEPVVVWTGVPGIYPAPWNGAAATIAAPGTVGVYGVWVRSAFVADDAAAIAEFKAQTPTVDGTQDKKCGPNLTVFDGFMVTFTSCTPNPTAPTVSQNVTFTGTGGQVRAATAADVVKLVLGFRDAAGNWVGGDPQVAWTGTPGTSLVPWAGAVVTIAAPNAGGAYGVWVREVPTNDDATAIADFKAAVVPVEDLRNKTGATVTVPTPPPAYLVTFTRQTHAPEPAVLNEDVVVSNTGGEINGGTPADTMRIVLGFRDAAGNWVGGEPQVVWTGVPGVMPAPWNGAAATIAAPGTVGTYGVWVRSAFVADDAAAIAEFKAQTPVADGTQDKRCGPDLTVFDGFMVTFTSCTLSTNAPKVDENVTITGTGGEVRAATAADVVKLVLGFRDAAGNWAGGEPLVVWTGTPGTSLVPWAGAAAIIAAPNAGGVYGVWVREVPTNDDPTAIADFKAAVVPLEDLRNKRGATVTVPAPPPAYTVTFTSQTHNPETAIRNENVLVFDTGGEINGGTPADTMRVVLGFRDAGGNWAGGEPQVVWTGTPGIYPAPWAGAAVTIIAPGTVGAYAVWVRSAFVADDAAAIAEFKAQTPTADGTQDKKCGALLYVTLDPSGLRFDFGTPSSPIEAGYWQMTPKIDYTVARGYGWLRSKVSATDTKLGGALTRDFCLAKTMTFVADVPNGTYDVALTMGDANKAHDQVAVIIEGVQLDTLSPQRNEFLTRTYLVAIADGQVTLTLTDLGGRDSNAVINGLTVTMIPTSGTLAKVAGPRRLPPKPAAEEELAILAVPPTGRAPLEVAFAALGVKPADKCVWQFGDGPSGGKGAIASHTYWSPGTYTVTLTVGAKTARATVVVTD